MEVLQTTLAITLQSHESIGYHSPVNLGSGDALREEASHQTLFVGKPIFSLGNNGKRSYNGYILLLEIANGRVCIAR